MDILLQALVIVALIVPILIGFLMGSVRGLRRSIIRLVLVALSIVLAFVLRGTVTEQIMNFQINGQTINDIIVSYVSQMLQGFELPVETIVNIASLLVLAISFLLSLNLLLFVTWAIIFPICKLFVRNKKSNDDDGKHKKRRKHNGLSRLLGSILGLAQGVAVAVVCVTVLNGLFFNLSNIAVTMNSMSGESEQSSVSSSEVATHDEEDDSVEFLKAITKYNDSGIRKFINKMGGDRLFDTIVTIEKEDGKKVTLTGQIDAFRGVISMGMELSKLQNLEMVGGLSGSTAEQLTAIFNQLDEINGNLSDESKETINDLVKAVAEQMLPDLDIDLDKLNFKTVDFKNEGQVIADLSSYKETDFSDLTTDEARETAKEIVNTVMKSDILLPLLSSNSEFTIGLEGDNYEFAKNIIEEMEQNPESDKDKVEMLKSFFGLNDEQQPSQPVPNQPVPEQPEAPEQNEELEKAA